MKHPARWITVLSVIMLFVFINNSLKPVFFNLAEVEAVRIANKAINEVIDREIENIKYDDLISYQMDKSGNIVMMQPNIREINRFSSRIALDIQSRLEEVTGVTVDVPLFKVLGFDLLAGFGPTVKARVIPRGYTYPPRIKDSFQSAGINQTKHKIYLDVEAKLKLIIPFFQQTTTINADVPLIEVTILGRVPEIYVGLNEEQLPGIIYLPE